MKAKELKKLLEGVDENAEILISDVEEKCLQVVGSDNHYGNLILDVRQEFPEAYYKDGEEIRWINGKAVIPVIPNEEVFDLSLTNSGVFNDGREHILTFEFHDGHAVCRDDETIEMVYPTLHELTDEKMTEIDDYIGERASDSGCITPGDVCLKFGAVRRCEPKAKENSAILRLDNDASLICESIQEITIVAWPMIYGKTNPHDLDSRNVLDTFRRWGEEFESWWRGHDEDWIDAHDYLEEVEDFALKKASLWLAELTEA